MPERRRTVIKVGPNGRLFPRVPWTAPPFPQQQASFKGVECWLARWLTHTDFDAGGRCLYMRRWKLGKVRGFVLYLHHWLASDWAIHLHNHSRHMLSIGLCGQYTEELPHGCTKTWRAPWIRFFRSEHQHRVLLDRTPCWTVILAWPISGNSQIFVDGEGYGASAYLDSPAAANNPGC